MAIVEALVDRCDVYTEDPSTTRMTAVARTGLVCRLTHIAPTGGSGERAELQARRRLLWEPGYAMPEYAEVDIDGQRWRVVAGTLATMRGPDGTESHRRCDLVRVL